MVEWPEDEVENLRIMQLPVPTEVITGRPGSTASSVALHEASHAVVGNALGAEFVSVTITSKWIERETAEGWIGRSAYGRVEYDLTERAGALAYDPESVVLEILAPTAACALIGFSRIGLLPDQEQIALLAEKVFHIPTSEDGLTPEAEAWITDMHRRAADIVRPLLKGIVRVAEQLDLRQTLSYEEVREILASDRK